MLKNLKLLRNMVGISQQRLADAIGVTQQSINKYENHNIEPDIATLSALADHFGVSVDYIIGRISDEAESAQHTELTEQEQQLIAKFRFMDKEKRSLLLSIADCIAAHRPV